MHPFGSVKGVAVAFVVAVSLSTAAVPAQSESPGLADRLRGTWSAAASGQLLHFDGDRCVVAFHLQQTLMRVSYDDAAMPGFRPISG